MAEMNETMEARLASMETDMKGMKAFTGYGINKASATAIVLAAIGGMFGTLIIFGLGYNIAGRRRKIISNNNGEA